MNLSFKSMNKTVSVITLIICVITLKCCFAQDIIKKNNGEKLDVKIVATSKTEITYIVKTVDQKDSVISIDKQLCYSIQMAGQTEEILFAREKELAKIVTKADSLEEYRQGKQDANEYYTKYKKPGRLVLVTSLISPIVGLVPAIVSTSTKVKEENKFYPDPVGTKIDLYYKGYSKEAKKIKVNVVWKNWTIGFVTNLVLVYVLYNRYY